VAMMPRKKLIFLLSRLLFPAAEYRGSRASGQDGEVRAWLPPDNSPVVASIPILGRFLYAVDPIRSSMDLHVSLSPARGERGSRPSFL